MRCFPETGPAALASRIQRPRRHPVVAMVPTGPHQSPPLLTGSVLGSNWVSLPSLGVSGSSYLDQTVARSLQPLQYTLITWQHQGGKGGKVALGSSLLPRSAAKNPHHENPSIHMCILCKHLLLAYCMPGSRLRTGMERHKKGPCPSACDLRPGQTDVLKGFGTQTGGGLLSLLREACKRLLQPFIPA